MTEDVQIRNFDPKSKISKWPYLQFLRVQIQKHHFYYHDFFLRGEAVAKGLEIQTERGATVARKTATSRTVAVRAVVLLIMIVHGWRRRWVRLIGMGTGQVPAFLLGYEDRAST